MLSCKNAGANASSALCGCCASLRTLILRMKWYYPLSVVGAQSLLAESVHAEVYSAVLSVRVHI
jgi:hypothetical protein